MSGSLSNIWHFLRLIRFGNVFMIAFTMVIVKYLVFEAWVLKTMSEGGTSNHQMVIEEWMDLASNMTLNFVLLVICVCSIAAAGNIINDYFDIKADRINRPEKIVIGKYIKRRWAIVTHWGFNALGTAIALYLSWYYKSWWLLFVPLSSAGLLWLYSVYLKKRLFVGNFFIASLTAVVILLTSHFMLLNWPSAEDLFVQSAGRIALKVPLFLSGLLAVFAFITNLTREIVKDLHDVEGDLKIHCTTIPILHGPRFTRILIGFFLFFQFMAVGMMLVVGSQRLSEESNNWFPLFIVSALILLYGTCFIINITAKSKKQHYVISFLLKIIMFIGLLFPFNVLL